MDIFCKIINGELPSNVCYEDVDVMAIMDVSPAAPGHVLVIPKKHYTSVLDMDSEIIEKIHSVAVELIKKMESVYPSSLSGIKLIVNYGEPQKVKHYHLHLVPTYSGEAPNLNQEEFAKLLK